MTDQVTERYGDVEVVAPGDHAAYAKVVSELRDYMHHIGVLNALDRCDVRFVSSSEMFSRVLRRIKSTPSLNDSTARNVTTETVICVDLVGIYFFERFTENMFAPQQALWQYVEGSLTGTIAAVDREGFMSSDRGFLSAPTRCLAEEHSELLDKIRKTPDEFWERSMLEVLRKLRHSALNWLKDGPPFQADYEELAGLIYRTIVRFTLGHELGHCIRDNRASLPFWAKKVDTLRQVLGEADPAADTELFSDCIAIDCAIYNLRNSESTDYDARIVIAILLIVIHLTDSMSVGAGLANEVEGQRAFYSGRQRVAYLRSLIEVNHAWVGQDVMRVSASTMNMDVDLSELALALSVNMHGIVDAIRDRAAVRRKATSQAYTATVRAFSS